MSQLKKMTIHEKIRYLREERALHAWERAVAEWDKLKMRMATKTGRVFPSSPHSFVSIYLYAPQELDRVLLTRSEKYREVMEQREIIERALAAKDYEVDKLFSTTLKSVGRHGDGLFIELRPPSRAPYAFLSSYHSPSPTTAVYILIIL